MKGQEESSEPQTFRSFGNVSFGGVEVPRECHISILQRPSRCKWVGLGSPGEDHSAEAVSAQVQVTAIMGGGVCHPEHLVSLEEPNI